MGTGLFRRILIFLAAAWLASAALAEDLPVAPVAGRIERVYVRLSNNFFREVRAGEFSGNGERWVDVRPRVEDSIGAGRTVIALVPEGLMVRRGDTVSVKLARESSKSSRSASPIRDHDRIVAVIPALPVYMAWRQAGTGPNIPPPTETVVERSNP